ncbi:MAG TPA: DUF501 domain-containing protein [Mycobacteriales bacterium]|jgi:Uncharacterized conserved protein
MGTEGHVTGGGSGDADPAGAVTATDLAAVAAQLGRVPRAIHSVAHRCPCGLPDVVRTAPRLADGAPFPTLYYLTCPRAASAVSTVEVSGLMREMTDRLRVDPDLAAGYLRAHQEYLRDRARLGQVPEVAHISAGGMPERVKCLHALVAHSLAVGPGVNPVGDQALALLPDWWAAGPCVTVVGA